MCMCSPSPIPSVGVWMVYTTFSLYKHYIHSLDSHCVYTIIHYFHPTCTLWCKHIYTHMEDFSFLMVRGVALDRVLSPLPTLV